MEWWIYFHTKNNTKEKRKLIYFLAVIPARVGHGSGTAWRHQCCCCFPVEIENNSSKQKDQKEKQMNEWSNFKLYTERWASLKCVTKKKWMKRPVGSTRISRWLRWETREGWPAIPVTTFYQWIEEWKEKTNLTLIGGTMINLLICNPCGCTDWSADRSNKT